MNQTEQHGKRFGKAFIVATWLIVIVLLTLFFNKQLDKQRNPNQEIDGAITLQGAKEIVLKRNRAGHYVATGQINHRNVEFFVDTGASNVAVPAHLAKHLGLSPERTIIYQTANGNVRGYTTTIETIALGNIIINNVGGGINPGMKDDHILLGMSFLKHVEFTQRGDQLIIRQLAI